MFGNMTVGKRLIAGFGASALTLVVIAVVSFHNAELLIGNESWVAHTYQVRNDLADLLSELKDAETGQRGYLITGADKYLEPYNSGVASADRTFADLRRLTADNPNQQRRLDALKPLVDRKFAELKETIELRRSRGFEAAQKVVATDAGKVFMDQIRGIVGEADQEERSLGHERTDTARASATTTQTVIL